MRSPCDGPFYLLLCELDARTCISVGTRIRISVGTRMRTWLPLRCVGRETPLGAHEAGNGVLEAAYAKGIRHLGYADYGTLCRGHGFGP